MSFDIKPGIRRDIPLSARSIEVTRTKIKQILDELGATPDAIVIHNKTKTCRVNVIIQSHTVFIEVTNEEQDQIFRLEEVPPQTPNEKENPT